MAASRPPFLHAALVLLFAGAAASASAVAPGPAEAPARDPAASATPDTGPRDRHPHRMVPPLAPGAKRRIDPPPATAAEPPLVDVVVLYTDGARLMHGNTADGMRARIAELESGANRVYRDSDAGVRIRVVGSAEIALPPPEYFIHDNVEYFFNSEILYAMSVPSGLAFKQAVDARREEFGADAVVLLNTVPTDFEQTCGVGWWLGYHGAPFRDDYAFAVVSEGRLRYGRYACDSDVEMAHQLGHLFGAGDDKASSGGPPYDDHGAWSFSRGYRHRSLVMPEKGFVTVVGDAARHVGEHHYPIDETAKVPLLSNPDRVCNGRPCGVAGYADNARTHRQSAPALAKFRATRVPLPAGPALSVADASVAEGDTGTAALRFVVALSAPAAAPVTFRARTVARTAVAGEDFEPVAATYTIPAGDTTIAVVVPVIGDTVPEDAEALGLVVYDLVGARALDGIATATGSIVENDVGVIVRDAGVAEGEPGESPVMRFKVDLTAPSPAPVTLKLTTVPCCLVASPAEAGVDYVWTSRTLTIPAGARSAPFDVRVIGDDEPEAVRELLRVMASNVTGAGVVRGGAFGRIVEDETHLSLSIDNELPEGDGGWYDHDIVVRLRDPIPLPVRFSVATAPGTANDGEDFEGVAASGVIPAGEVSARVPMRINGDTLFESDYESFSVTLTSPDLPAPPTATILIVDDEPSPEPVRLRVAPASGYEGSGINGQPTMTFRVDLDYERTRGDVTFDARLVAGTATPGEDYVDFGVRSYRIGAGWMDAQLVTVEIVGDQVPEPDETYTLELFNVVGAEVSQGTATGTIRNDDAELRIDIGDGIGVEGDGTDQTFVRFPLTLAGGAIDRNVSGSYVVEYLDASPEDVILYSGTFLVTWHDYEEEPPYLGVRIAADEIVEAPERIRVRLVGISGALPGDVEAIGTIVDDDGATVRTIGEVQGRSGRSPFDGQDVWTEGVVTAATATGYFLQSVVPDGDARTSDGIFVETGASGHLYDIGSQVRLVGTVREVPDPDRRRATTTTRIVPIHEIRRTWATLPAPRKLDASVLGPGMPAALLERYEGMRVVFPELRVVAPNRGHDPTTATGADTWCRFDAVPGAAMARPFREAGLHPADTFVFPGGAAGPRSDGNVERIRIRPDVRVDDRGNGSCTLANAGDTILGLEGVLDDDEGYRLLPPPSPIAVRQGSTPRPVAAPAAAEASIGLLNAPLFDAWDNPEIDDAPNPPLQHIVMHSAAKFVCHGLRSPDIVAVVGVETRTLLEDLAEEIRTGFDVYEDPLPCGGARPTYEAIHRPTDAADGLDIGFLVDPSVVVERTLQVGTSERLRNPDGSAVPLFAVPPLQLDARLPVAGRATPVTVLAVRLEPATGSASAEPGEAGWSTRGARVRARRAAQAAYLARWADAYQQANPMRPLVLTGDLDAPRANDAFVDVVGALTGAEATAVANPTGASMVRPLVDLGAGLPPAERYNAVVEGEAQALDHALVGEGVAAAGLAARVDHARMGADFTPDGLYQNDPLGFSRRDPLVVHLASATAAADLSVAAGARTMSGAGTTTVALRNHGPGRAYDAVLMIEVSLTPKSVRIAAPAGWTCATVAIAGGTRAGCRTDLPVAAGEERLFGLELRPEPGTAVIRVTAEATASAPDPTPANNRDEVGLAR